MLHCKGATGFIPGPSWGTKIPHDTGHDQIKNNNNKLTLKSFIKINQVTLSSYVIWSIELYGLEA